MSSSASPQRVATTAIDVGSTVVKVALLDAQVQLTEQRIFRRDFERGIAPQVEAVLAQLGIDSHADRILICSSANGGLRLPVRRAHAETLTAQVVIDPPRFCQRLDESCSDDCARYASCSTCRR